MQCPLVVGLAGRAGAGVLMGLKLFSILGDTTI